MSSITAILTAYRRPALLRAQVEAVRGQGVPPRALWLWVNQPDDRMRREIDSLAVDRVTVCSDNAHVHARFALALLAPTEFVALFDDDALPGPNWFANCLDTMRQTPGILGSAGVRLVDNGYRNRQLFGWHAPCAETVEVDLVGHAWLLRTEWVKYLFHAPALVGGNGEDIELAARAWRLGQVRCYCPPHPPGDRSRWGSLHGEEQGGDAVAASRRPEHLDERDRVVRAEIAAGWRPLCFRPEAISASEAPPVAQEDAYSLFPDPPRPAAHLELLDMLPPGVRRILELGHECSHVRAGLRGRSWFGERYDAVPLAKVAGFDSAPAGYDCVILNRPETLADPARLVRQARRWLTPEGSLFVAFPTARHHSLVTALLSGRWGPQRPWHPGYEQVRLFTRREAEKLLYRAGYAIAEVRALPGEGYSEWVERGRPGEVRVGALHSSGLSQEDAEEFHTWGYLFRALPVAEADFGLTSLVIVTHNELAYTRLCVESIRLRTDEPYELIFVDNGSSDGTPDYLRSLEGVTVIANKDNRGFPAAANQGIRAATGRQVLLLNNDTLVTTGWLGRMLRVLHSDPSIGLVGPGSNSVSGEQQVAVSYEALEDLDGFAWDWGKDHAGARADTDRLVGFCLLIRREALDTVGLLDERFGIGCFDDDDYCLRVRRAGFRAVIAGDALVHHFGGRTFAGTGTDFAALMQRNQRLFEEKWAGEAGKPIPEPPTYSAREAEGGGLVLVPEAVPATIVMIARNNARTIGPALESIRKFIPDMVVVDTGSTDETPQVASRLGARIFHFPWCDSFAAARNESLRHARGRWVFWMDSDDTIDEANGRGLCELIRQPAAPDLLGYVVSVHCPGPDPDDPGGFTRVTHVKLIRNLPHLRFEGRIHEQILPAIQRAGGQVGFTPLFVVHSGYDASPEGQKPKLARDLRLLHLELREQPEHPFTLFNLGMTYQDVGRFREAAVYLERCLARSAEQASHVRKAHAYLVSCWQGLHDWRRAWQACARGLAAFPLDAELRFRKAMLLHERRMLGEAAEAYQDVLTRREQVHFTSVNEGVSGHLARFNLGRVYQDLGDPDRAQKQWRQILADHPGFRPAYEALADIGGLSPPRRERRQSMRART